MNKDLLAIFEYLEREKGIKRDIIIKAIEESLLIAARKSTKGLVNLSVKVDPRTAEIIVTAQKEVVEHVTIPDEEIALEDARVLSPRAQIGDWIDISVPTHDFGRIAAQTARQVISQKLRTAERDVIYEEYRHRINEIVSGAVKRIIRGNTLIIDLGKVEAILPERFYPKTERYNVGDRVIALLSEVRDTENGGAEVILSRSSPEFVRQLFMQEVPELNENVIEIVRIVRDAGYRTKLAVRSYDMKIDPVGACVGIRGSRVKNIIRELNNEKIDIIPYSENPVRLLEHALDPVQIKKMDTSHIDYKISIVVEDEDYPTVLGKRGMNARLNGELIGVELEVQKMTEYKKLMKLQSAELASSDDPTLDDKLALSGMSNLVLESLISAGFDTPRKVLSSSAEEISSKAEISPEMAEKIIEEIRKKRI